MFFFFSFFRLQNKKGRRTPDRRLKQKGRGSIASWRTCRLALFSLLHTIGLNRSVFPTDSRKKEEKVYSVLVLDYWPNYNVLIERWHCSTNHCRLLMQTGLFHVFFHSLIQLMIKSNSCLDSVSSVGRVPVCWAYLGQWPDHQPRFSKRKLSGKILLAVWVKLFLKRVGDVGTNEVAA